MSGVHGAISAGFGNVKQQFYEKGSLEAIDWGEVAGKSTVGGITGTATAYGGAKLSEGLTAKLSQNAFVDSLLHSDSAAKRVANRRKRQRSMGASNQSAKHTLRRYARRINGWCKRNTKTY